MWLIERYCGAWVTVAKGELLMRRRFCGAILATSLVLSVGIGTSAHADPADQVPKGPYSATLIAEKILYPSMFGVPAGLPVADVSGVQLANGKLRAYVFAQNKGVVIAESSDGKTFAQVGSAFGSDNGQGMPRAVKLADGRIRLYTMSGEGVTCSTSSDGITFTIEKVGCILASWYTGAPNGLTGASIVKLSNGTYRAFFSDAVKAGTGPDPHRVYSATSSDGVNWAADPGVRVGEGTSLSRSAEHPAAVAHSDGSVTIFYFDNGARPGLDSAGKQKMEPNAMGLWYATSTDGGLTFSNEYKIEFPSQFSKSFGNDPDVFLDAAGNIILWAGGFDNAFGGYIGAVKLTKGAGSTGSSGSTSGGSTTKPTAPKKVTITCVKGSTTKKVTAVKPLCPPGYKKK
jgi:hypothetical protein